MYQTNPQMSTWEAGFRPRKATNISGIRPVLPGFFK